MIHRRDFLGQTAGSMRLAGRVWLRSAKASWSSRELMEILGDVLAVSGMESTPYCCLHHRIDEAPADGGVVDLGAAGKGRVGLGHDEGRAGHAFDAAGDHQICLAGLDARAASTASMPEPHSRLMVVPGPLSAGPPAASTCGRRCGCPRRPGWRSRRSLRRRLPSRRRRCAPSVRAAGPRPDHRRGHWKAPRRNGRSGCGCNRR
jgi:hypothetical protein